MIPQLILLVTLLGMPSLATRDPALARFHLATQEPEPQQCEPSVWFDRLGWLTYGATATFLGSQEYRESRSSSYEPQIDNLIARAGVQAATAESINWSSEKLYRSCKIKWAWMARGFGVAAIGLQAGKTFEDGWNRR